jgi:hypothetical protein
MRLIPLLLALSVVLGAETMRFDLQYLGVSWIKVEMTDDGQTLSICAQSTGLADSWAFTDNSYTLSYRDDHLPDVYRKAIHQKEYRENSTTCYDRQAGTARFENRDSSQLPRTYRIDPQVRDFFSALYYLRFNPGVSEISLDANGLIWKAMVRPMGVEKLATPWGKVDCDRVRITFRKVTPGEPRNSDMLTNNLVREKNTLDFWITRDERKAPVRAEYRMFPWSVVWKLREYMP